MYSSECRPLVPIIFVTGTIIEFDEHYDPRIGKVRARNVRVRTNPCATDESPGIEDAGQPEGTPCKKQRVSLLICSIVTWAILTELPFVILIIIRKQGLSFPSSFTLPCLPVFLHSIP